jgi:hypothetical protein
MKVFARIALLILFVFVLVLPALAQEATPEPIPDDLTAPAPVVVIQQPAIDNGTIIAIGALIVLAITVFTAITRGASADKAVTVALEGLRANRDAMTRYESMYAESQFTARQGYDALVSVVNAIAALTPWEFDDELGDVLEDVQQPGAPPA